MSEMIELLVNRSRDSEKAMLLLDEAGIEYRKNMSRWYEITCGVLFSL